MKTRASAARAGLLLALALAGLGSARPAYASSVYPDALAQAIAHSPTIQQKFPNAVTCVPLCTACHLTTAGGPGMLNRFGMTLETVGGLGPYNPALGKDPAALVKDAFDKVTAADPDSDGDGTRDIEEIVIGDSPSLAAPNGATQFCPDIKYGCGAHISAAHSVDRVGLFSAGLVVLSFALVRRRGSPRRGRAN